MLVSLLSRVILFDRIRIYINRQRQLVEIERCLFLCLIYMVLKSLVTMKKNIGRLSFDQDELLYMNQEAKQQRGVSSEKVVRFFASLIFGFIYVILTS